MTVRRLLVISICLLSLWALRLYAAPVAAVGWQATETAGAASGTNRTKASPLGPLSPAPNLLPAGSVSVTLSLTSTLAANCRWSGASAVPYASMEHEFQQGQGTNDHVTLVTGLHDLDDRWFYVRCQDLTGTRDPDRDQVSTHLRVLGPWHAGYPRIANLWIDPHNLGVPFYAGYDLLMPYSWPGQAGLLAAIRATNPSIKILHTQYATKGKFGVDPLATEWRNSRPGEPGYGCLLRDSHGSILLVQYWGTPMYNMTQPYCREQVLKRNIALFLASQPDAGDNLAYDGIYWDRLHNSISWLGSDIDANLDGQADDPETLNAAYQAGVEEFLAQIHAALPRAILQGNEAGPSYRSWINGKVYEWQVNEMLNGRPWSTWAALLADIQAWTGAAQPPAISLVLGAPEPLYDEKYRGQPLSRMPAAMMAEAAASYQRMRFGLVTALMGDATFAFDFGAYEHGQPWWYDEYGAPGGASGGGAELSLPRHGYLGQPTGAPALLVDRLTTSNQVRNGDFAGGLAGWQWAVDTRRGAKATLDLAATGGISGTGAVHIAVTDPGERWSVELSQRGAGTDAGQNYTVSFWARSGASRSIHFLVEDAVTGADVYEAEASLTPQWQHFHLWTKADAVAPANGRIAFQVGGEVGDLWLADVEFQQGALGMWARPFLNGMAVINTTGEAQTAALPGAFCKLKGPQAPLFQARLDDNQAAAAPGWGRQPANDSQFGPTVHVAAPGSGASITYTPTLAYGGNYQVLAWVAPAATQSNAVPITIRHAGSQIVVSLDETTGEVGWHSLGEYAFEAGDTGSITFGAGAEGTTFADAVKWVSVARYNDGSQVKEVSLQPYDAVVLLHSCFDSAGAAYLPLVMRR